MNGLVLTQTTGNRIERTKEPIGSEEGMKDLPYTQLVMTPTLRAPSCFLGIF